MKKHIMKKWVEALRSGEFKQRTGYLNKGGEHCCLGVLCELALVEGKIESNISNMNYTVYGIDENFGTLPEEVMKWSGIKNNRGRLDDTSLASLNDGGMSFKKIANIIEKNYKKL